MELKLHKTKHPNVKLYLPRYNNLIGVEKQKSELLITLELILNKGRLAKWMKQHHDNELPFLSKGLQLSPLIILSGEVGCGKTELAQTIATPLAEQLDSLIWTLQTPSDIRGTGLVGQLSSRITAAFTQAISEVGDGYGLLIIDEADDLASNRDSVQSHHEDKAGVNVLIKELDGIEHGKKNIAVILITNRMSALDPAVVRRASLQLEFHRPGSKELTTVFRQILKGTNATDAEIDILKALAAKNKIPYSYSDLIQRVGKQALLKAISRDIPFGADLVEETLKDTSPTPLVS